MRSILPVRFSYKDVLAIGCASLLLVTLGGCSQKQSTKQRPELARRDASLSLDTTPPDSADRLVNGVFFGESEATIRHALAFAEVTHISKGSGGRSIGFKVTLTDGSKGYFKPEQTFSGANFYSELAAYYLDRELGLGRVPPTVGRILPFKQLERPLGLDERREEMIVQPDGRVRGALIHWIDEKLIPLAPGKAWERWVRMKGWPTSAVTPFQRPRVYLEKLGLPVPNDEHHRARVMRGHTGDAGTETDPSALDHLDSQGVRIRREELVHKEPDTPERPAELSDMIVFDYLTMNLDRWGGDYTNVRTMGAGGPLVYLDNGAGFIGQATNGLMRSRLHTVEKFRRATIEAIRNLDLEKLKARMQSDPLWPFIDPQQIENIALRKAHVLEHVAAMYAKYGDAIYPW